MKQLLQLIYNPNNGKDDIDRNNGKKNNSSKGQKNGYAKREHGKKTVKDMGEHL